MRLRVTYPLILAAVLVALGAGLSAQRAESPQALLRRAIDTETVDGDLSGAIKQYQVIAERYERTDRGAAATALLRMAACYEKLGDPRARRVYEGIVNDFGDRTEEARLAQARLGSTATTGRNELTTTRVRADGSLYRLSPDGQFYLGHRQGDAHLIELTTGNARQLTFQPEADSQVWEHAFSLTGDRVAYAWYTEKDNRVRLRLVATAGTSKAPPRTLVDNPEITEILPYDWSRDGRWIAVLVKRVDKIAQIALVNPETGSLSVLHTVDWNGVGGLRFSPDSRWLAFHRPERDGSFERDVFAIALDSSRLVPAAATQADESVVEWTPDGQRLLVASDRGGSVGIWGVPFHQGAPDSRLELVRPDVGYIRSAALSASGALFYTQLRGSADIYMAPFDPATGRLTSAPVQPIQRYSGFNWLPEWSSDGKYLAYVSQRDLNNVGRHVVVIHSIESGTTVREVRPTLSYLAFPRWSPDGREFVARGALRGKSGIVKFDAVTGVAALVAPNETCSSLPLWAPSGRSIFCYNQNERAIREVDADSGTVIRSYPGTGLPSSVSPDGRYLVDASLKVVTLATGATQVALQETADFVSGGVAAIAWTPDSRNIAFAGIIRGVAGIWLVSMDGGEPRKLLDVPVASRDARGITRAVSKLGFNPKTGEMVYSLAAAATRDVWKMENFLPNSTDRPGGPRAR